LYHIGIENKICLIPIQIHSIWQVIRCSFSSYFETQNRQRLMPRCFPCFHRNPLRLVEPLGISSSASGQSHRSPPLPWINVATNRLPQISIKSPQFGPIGRSLPIWSSGKKFAPIRASITRCLDAQPSDQPIDSSHRQFFSLDIECKIYKFGARSF
jgi:hypothetical protein